MIYAHMVDCLTDEQCDQIIEGTKEREFYRAVVLHGKGVKESDIRTNSSVSLPKDLDAMAHKAINEAVVRWGKTIQSFYPEITWTAQLPGITHNLNTYKESINMLRYETNQKYDWHVDQSFLGAGPDSVKAKERLISAVVYLNDDFEGGETQMPEKIWKPKKGKALIFPSHWTFPHQARPVTKGTKYALVTWFHAE